MTARHVSSRTWPLGLFSLRLQLGPAIPFGAERLDLKKHAWNLRARDLRMRRLHQKLDSGLNILAGQAAQRQKFLTERRAITNSN